MSKIIKTTIYFIIALIGMVAICLGMLYETIYVGKLVCLLTKNLVAYSNSDLFAIGFITQLFCGGLIGIWFLIYNEID